MLILNVKNTFNLLRSESIPMAACPKCEVKNTLEMTFYQLHSDSGLIYRVTKKISASVYCTSCNSNIPNVKWTPELENHFDTRKHSIKIEKPTKTYSNTYKFILIFIASLLLIASYFILASYLKNQVKKDIIHNPKIGDVFFTSYAFRLSLAEYDRHGFTWTRIIGMDSDTLVLQFHHNKNITKADHIDLSRENFNGRIIKVSKSIFTEKNELRSFSLTKEADRFGDYHAEFSQSIYEYKRLKK